MVQKHGFYAYYHAPSDRLLACSVDSVLRQYDHHGEDWTAQETLTVTFRNELTVEALHALAELVRSGTRSTRDRRIGQITVELSALPAMLRAAVTTLHVPAERTAAADLLQRLYQDGADDVISAAFDEFAAVLGVEDDAIGACYMAEVNRGMDGKSRHASRIEAAIQHFRLKLTEGRYQPGSLHYTLGNALRRG